MAELCRLGYQAPAGEVAVKTQGRRGGQADRSRLRAALLGFFRRDREEVLVKSAGLSDGAEKREESGSATFARHLPVADEIIVIIWLRRARREVLKVRSRGDAVRPRTGVSSTRSPGSPNPLGLHPREGVGN